MSDVTMFMLAVGISLVLGVLLGYFAGRDRRSVIHYAGDIIVGDGPHGQKIYSLSLNCEPEDLLWQDKVMFHIMSQ